MPSGSGAACYSEDVAKETPDPLETLAEELERLPAGEYERGIVLRRAQELLVEAHGQTAFDQVRKLVLAGNGERAAKLVRAYAEQGSGVPRRALLFVALLAFVVLVALGAMMFEL
ncbi:MAG: hypothetical protein SangKO_005290 [Sandaracinaceae bacterium]|nr:hypothetical protein [Myxococcales bacterium]